MTADAPRTLLVLRALGLGDLMAAVPALRGLRAAFPLAELVLAAPRPIGTLMVAGGLADRVLPAAPLAPLPPSTGADLAVNMHGSGPESHRVLLATDARRLLAFRHPGVWEDGPLWRADEHERGRWCRLVAGAGAPASPDDVRLPVPPDPDPEAAGAVVVHPGAAAGARMWPAERFAEVARAAAEAGPVLVTGSEAERPLARTVARTAGLSSRAVLAGRTSLPQLAAVVAGAAAVVSGDTGVAHLAVAVGTPTVTVFGPTPPSLWGPPDDPRHRVLWAGIPGDPLAAGPGAGLLAVTPGAVLTALTDLLTGSGVAAQ